MYLQRSTTLVAIFAAALLGCSEDAPTGPEDPDKAPIVAAPGTVSGTEGAFIGFDVSAADPDGDAIATLTADLSKLPAGHTATFSRVWDLTSGHFSWRPTSVDSGAYDVTFAASNALRSNRVTTRVLVDGGFDDPPTVTAPASVMGITGVNLFWPVIIDDPDGDPIVFGFEGAADGSAHSGTSPIFATINWQPCKPGSYTAIVWARSGNPAQTDTAWTEITVTGTADHYVDIVGGAQHFEPDTITIQDGETVAWRSVDNQVHEIYGEDWVYLEGYVKSGCESRAMTFPAYTYPPSPRTYRYFCYSPGVHPLSGFGVIIVNPR